MKGLGRVAILGIVTGLRSQMPLALLSLEASRRGDGGILGHRLTLGVLGLGAVSEVVIDKFPMVPPRTEPGSLAARVALGALSGSILGRWHGVPVVAGIVTGASGALLGSYAGYAMRSNLTAATDVPDLAWAGLEDVVAVTLGRRATQG